MICWSRFGLKVLLLGRLSFKMRVLITGGFGFIGGRLAVDLAKAGHFVVLGTREFVPSPSWLPQAEVVETVWADERILEQCCKSVDVVVHAAGMNAQDCIVDPISALDFNGLATARLVAAASRAKVKRFVYLSTAHVYASPLVGTITEETCPNNLHPYATSHLAGEYAVLSANQQKQIQGIVLRLSNAFGAPVHTDVNCWMLLVNDLCRQAVQTRKLVLQTNGMQQRDFIAITEVCRVVESLADIQIEPTQSSIFNIGSGVSQSVLAMALLIQQRCKVVLGFEPVLERVQDRVNELHPNLNYRTDNLAILGIFFNNTDNTLEIDNLLRFCHSSFTGMYS